MDVDGDRRRLQRLGVETRRGLFEALGIGQEDLDAIRAQRGCFRKRIDSRDVRADRDHPREYSGGYLLPFPFVRTASASANSRRGPSLRGAMIESISP